MRNLGLGLFASIFLLGCGDDGGSASADAGADAAAADAARPADYNAYLRLIRQEAYREDDAFAAGGTARLYFFAAEPLPGDDRMRFANGDGEECTMESGTEWPTVPKIGVEWPSSPLLGAGDLSITVQDGPNTIVFEETEGAYFRKEPAPLVQGDFTHSSFFDGANLPSGKAFTLSTMGGAGVGALSFAGDLPNDYSVSSPDMETGRDVIDVSKALTFTWSPAQPGARMEVIVKDAFSFLRCNFADDGLATVPAEAMAQLAAGQFSSVSIQTLRQVAVTKQVEDDGGKIVDVDFIAEHVRFGRFDSTNGE